MPGELICGRCLTRSPGSWLTRARPCPHCGAEALRRVDSRLGRLLVARAAQRQRDRILARVRDQAAALDGEPDPLVRLT